MTNLETKSNAERKPDSVLKTLEQRKKGKYEKDCANVNRSFSPFVLSVDGMHGKLAKSVMRQIASLIAKRWRKPYTVTCGYVKGMISIATVRETNRCLRGSRTPASLISSRRQLWEDGSGLSLWR